MRDELWKAGESELERAGSGQTLDALGDGPSPRGGSPKGLHRFGKRRVAAIVACIVLAFVSIFPMADYFGKPETYAGSIASLDKKAETVTALAATSTAASALITLAPGDIGDPIAEKLVDISTDFAIVLAAIYLEKYLLTILSLASFHILFPVGLGTLVGVLLTRQGSKWQHVWGQLAFKFLVFALAAATVVPASVWVSDLVERTHQEDIAAAEAVVATNDDGSATDAQVSSETDEQTDDSSQKDSYSQSGGILDWLNNLRDDAANVVADASDAVTSGATKLLETGKETLNRLVEALVVSIVTDCVIPILVFVFFAWLCKMVLGINVDLSAGVGAAKASAHKAQGSLKGMKPIKN